MDTSFKCLDLIAQFHRFPVDEDQLAHQFSVAGQFFDVAAVLRAVKAFALKAQQVTVPSNKLLQPLLQVIVKMMFGIFPFSQKLRYQNRVVSTGYLFMMYVKLQHKEMVGHAFFKLQ